MHYRPAARLDDVPSSATFTDDRRWRAQPPLATLPTRATGCLRSHAMAARPPGARSAWRHSRQPSMAMSRWPFPLPFRVCRRTGANECRLFHLPRPCLVNAKPMFRQPGGSGEALPSVGLGRRPCRAPADKATDAAIQPSASGPNGRPCRTLFSEQSNSTVKHQYKEESEAFETGSKSRHGRPAGGRPGRHDTRLSDRFRCYGLTVPTAPFQAASEIAARRHRASTSYFPRSDRPASSAHFSRSGTGARAHMPVTWPR
jgi:hypothetical protein